MKRSGTRGEFLGLGWQCSADPGTHVQRLTAELAAESISSTSTVSLSASTVSMGVVGLAESSLFRAEGILANPTTFER